MPQAVGADLSKMPLCSENAESEPTETQTKIQKLIKHKGIHLSEKHRKHLTEPKQSGSGYSDYTKYELSITKTKTDTLRLILWSHSKVYYFYAIYFPLQL